MSCETFYNFGQICDRIHFNADKPHNNNTTQAEKKNRKRKGFPVFTSQRERFEKCLPNFFQGVIRHFGQVHIKFFRLSTVGWRYWTKALTILHFYPFSQVI